MDYEAVLQITISIARAAGDVVRDAFPRTALDHVGFKGAVDPVTETDIAAEKLIVSRLRAAFPRHRILAEESAQNPSGVLHFTRNSEGGVSGFSKKLFLSSGGDDWRAPGPPIWLIDPLDGTNNFAHGFPHVAISLGLLVEGQPAVGVIYDPLRDETFAAIAGGGAALNGQFIRVSGVKRLEDAFLATGFPYDRRTAPDNNVARLDHFVRRSQGARRAGAAVLDLAYVACGRFDGFWEIRLKPWDVAAGILLVREAGGRATDFEGGPDCVSGEFIVVSNGHIHDEMMGVIRAGSAAPKPNG